MVTHSSYISFQQDYDRLPPQWTKKRKGMVGNHEGQLKVVDNSNGVCYRWKTGVYGSVEGNSVVEWFNFL